VGNRSQPGDSQETEAAKPRLFRKSSHDRRAKDHNGKKNTQDAGLFGPVVKKHERSGRQMAVTSFDRGQEGQSSSFSSWYFLRQFPNELKKLAANPAAAMAFVSDITTRETLPQRSSSARVIQRSACSAANSRSWVTRTTVGLCLSFR
jgi:hypothetical protein